MQLLFPYFVTLLVGLVTNVGEAWSALPELPKPSNLGLGRERFGIVVLVADLLGCVLSFCGLALGKSVWIFIPIIPCIAISLFALASLVMNRWEWSPPSGQSHEAQPLRWLKVAALAVALVGAFILGRLFSADHNSEPIVRRSPYYVKGTETNGSGFLNECSEPSPCAGKSPVGRLKEGEPVEIECQTIGGVAKAAGGQSSRIWDRLYTGAFISDLFVSTHGAGHFSKGLRRCTPWK